MATTRRFEARLRKLEAAVPKRVTVFVVWGETEDQAQQAVERLRAAGTVRPTDNVTALAWPGPEPLPLSRRTDVEALSPEELDLVCAYHQSVAARHERAMAIAGGENIVGLDETDFYIRFLRRHRQYDELRMLGHSRNPSPEFHGVPCRAEQISRIPCESCARGETTPEGHAAWKRRYDAWMARYMAAT